MTAKYTIDPNDVTHLIDQTGDGEFTFCGLEQGCGNMTFDKQGNPAFGRDGEFEGIRSNGPADCVSCKTQFDKFKSSIGRARWGQELKISNWETNVNTETPHDT